MSKQSTKNTIMLTYLIFSVVAGEFVVVQTPSYSAARKAVR